MYPKEKREEDRSDNVIVLPLKQKVLVVDDDPINRHIWQEVLTGICHLDFASDGEEALKKYQTFYPSLVVLDRMMPGMSGDEVMQKIREMDTDGETKIILHSMLESTDDQLSGMKNGADLYIPKSTNIDIAVTQIQSLLKMHRQSQVSSLFKIARQQNRNRSYSSRLISEGVFRHAELMSQDIRAKEVDIFRCLRNLCISVESIDNAPKVNFSSDLDTDECLIMGDDDLLSHAFLSVLQRAISVTPKDEVVEVSLTLNDGYFMINVDDCGSRIPIQQAKEIFHFLNDPERIQVGLPISWETTQRHFGDLKLKQNSNGMTFTFQLPTPEKLDQLLT